MTHKGKIGRLPLALREQVNARLLAGEPGSAILPWLNAEPEAQRICAEYFGSQPINDNNLSEWRRGGYRDWLSRRDRIEHTRELARVSADLAKAGGQSLSEGAAGILAGRILDVLEKLDELAEAGSREGSEESEGSTSPTSSPSRDKMGLIGDYISDLTKAVSLLRAGDHAAARLRIDRERLAQTGEALELEKVKVIKLGHQKLAELIQSEQAQRILNDGATSHDEKTELLGREIFGDLWDGGTGHRPVAAGDTPGALPRASGK